MRELTGELDDLRRRMYSAAATFYKCQARHSDALRNGAPAEAVAQASAACATAASRYGSALDELLRHLQELGPDGQTQKQIERVRRRRELLDAELQQVLRG